MPPIRHTDNPIIKPSDVVPSRSDFEVVCVFNAGVARLGEEVILLLRVAERPRGSRADRHDAPIYNPQTGEVEVKSFHASMPGCDFSDSRFFRTPEGTYLTSLSHFRVARSRDGIRFDIPEQPSLFPANEYEEFGIEDPRVTKIGDTFYIVYAAVSRMGITGYMASTKDFVAFERHGVIFHPTNKDIAIFPEKINGKYYALHRPSPVFLGKKDIWLAESPDLHAWGNHRHLIGRAVDGWDSGHVGGSAVPFRTEQGWLEIYHGVDSNQEYSLGALLLDLEEPWRVLARSKNPIMKPEASYEKEGFFGNVVFTCGVLVEDGVVKLYYGASDTYIAYAELSLDEILESLV
ncbi:glycoside hydrolase family 130 protein [Paenibacillus roseipurpureus]|uniref:Glycoside hydrolase family 130 protein n=1 Tax=Paenibacillus roseopurpureus TaxID=2918901 RepID=A0AA96RP08_9BACL|nr:glycoside hydrolase family 130 protein [Paenibacillus sp. MBLB1832]WNR46147.1 glycoside hydrolase family 130 protein [Paenibacillus sp. MBLB1832]